MTIDIQPYLNKLDLLKEYINIKIDWGWLNGTPKWIKDKYGDFFYMPSFEEFYQRRLKQLNHERLSQGV